MKKLNLFIITILSFSFSFAQYSTTTEGNYDFVPKETLIGVKFDYSTVIINGFESMEKYVDFRYQDIELMENEKEAIKWKEGWEETITNANNEFILVINDEIGGKKAPVRFELGAKTKVHGVMNVTELSLPQDNGKNLLLGGGATAICVMSGTLTFYDADENVLSVETYKNIQGLPSTSIYTMGDGFKINSCYKKAALPLGKKLYKLYFEKKKK